MKNKNINETIKNEFLHYDEGELDRVLSMTKEELLYSLLMWRRVAYEFGYKDSNQTLLRRTIKNNKT